jgi:hypothetical protein
MMAGQALGGIFPALVNILVISLQVARIRVYNFFIFMLIP